MSWKHPLPEDLTYWPHHKFYWLPQHACGKPLLDGVRIRAAPPKPELTEPPY